MKLSCKKIGIFGEDSNTKIKIRNFKFKYNIKTLSQFFKILTVFRTGSLVTM